MIRCVVFDIGDTLLNTSETVEKTIKKTPELKLLSQRGHNVSKKQYEIARDYLAKAYKTLSKKQKARPHIYSWLMLKGLGITPTKELAKKMDTAFAKEQEKHRKPAKNASAILNFLRSKKITLAIITNSKNSRGVNALKKFGLTKYFSEILESHKVGFEKSELKPFRILKQKIRIKGRALDFSEFLMVGNDENEDLAAKKLGIKVALINKQKNKTLFKTLKPDYIINDLIEIKKIIANQEV